MTVCIDAASNMAVERTAGSHLLRRRRSPPALDDTAMPAEERMSEAEVSLRLAFYLLDYDLAASDVEVAPLCDPIQNQVMSSSSRRPGARSPRVTRAE